MGEHFSNLQKFIANNYNLERLEAKLSEFNPLKILKVDHYEIRHSNIISWLLSPQENHNLGSKFLKKTLSEVLINNEHIQTNYTVFDIEEMSYHDIQVKREYKNIDIFVISHSNKLAVLIENKVHSNESKGQLKKYLNSVHDEYPDYEVIPVFLALDDIEPSFKEYGLISYLQILHILHFTIETQKENLSKKVLDFINHYIQILELLTMEDIEIKKLCKKIYKDHKEALDLIYEYAEDTEFEESANEFINSIDALELGSDSRGAWFIPNKIRQNLQMIGEETWCMGFPLAFWFTAQEEKLGLILEVGPFLDSSIRNAFLDHLKKYDFKIHDRSFKPGAKYTRIYTTYPKFDDWDNKESIIQKMDDLYTKNAAKPINNLLKACETFHWGKD